MVKVSSVAAVLERAARAWFGPASCTTLAVVLSAASPPAGAQHHAPAAQLAQAGSESVWCHDVARALVRRKVAWQCEGEVVSEAEAARIKQARVDRVRRSLGVDSKPLVPGKRVRGTGTGFFVTARGQVLTNAHVVKGCGAVSVTPAGRAERHARVRVSDARRDLALLDAGQSSPGFARFRAGDGPGALEEVTVVGYPAHGLVSIRPKLVAGKMLKNEARNRPGIFAMRIDVRRGNSGGPVLDQGAQVVGVVFAKVDTPTVYAQTGKLIRDVGLGIRPGVVKKFLARHGVSTQGAAASPALDSAARLRRASEFVVQVRCWK